MFFRCMHPARWLVVQKDETRSRIDGYFEKVTYNLFCTKCSKEVAVSYARITVSEEDFLAYLPNQGKS